MPILGQKRLPADTCENAVAVEQTLRVCPEAKPAKTYGGLKSLLNASLKWENENESGNSCRWSRH